MKKSILVFLYLLSFNLLAQDFDNGLIKGKRYKAVFLEEYYGNIETGKKVYKTSDVLFYFTEDGNTLYTSESPENLKIFNIHHENHELLEDVHQDYVFTRMTDKGNFKPFLYVYNGIGPDYNTHLQILIQYGNITYWYHVVPTSDIVPGYNLEKKNQPLKTIEEQGGYGWDDPNEWDPGKLYKLHKLSMKFLLDPKSIKVEDVDKILNEN